jgi:hypothetical protein
VAGVGDLRVGRVCLTGHLMVRMMMFMVFSGRCFFGFPCEVFFFVFSGT